MEGLQMKCNVKYVVTIRWKHLGTREYTFDSFHDAYEAICNVYGMHPDIKITCKTERRN